MHQNNPNKDGYDMNALVNILPELKPFILKSKSNRLTIDFSDSKAVKALNRAILKKDYGVEFWDIPDGYLCPGIPGRADYLYHLADVIEVPEGRNISALDIGTGANLVYPLVASHALKWNVVATDVEAHSVNSAKEIVRLNKGLSKKIDVRQQPDKAFIFKNIIQKDEYFDVSICNPPFHASEQAATQGSERKSRNLKQNKSKRGSNLMASKNDALNFSGASNELWCKGGELVFIRDMIEQSIKFKDQVGLFTCLVAKKDHLPAIKMAFKTAKVKDFKIIEMSQGSKISRFVAWSF